MMMFGGGIKEREPRKFIVSMTASQSMAINASKEGKIADYGNFCDYATMRACKMGLSHHKVYSIKTASGAKSLISPRELAQTWNIGLETARRMLKVTTRLAPWNVHDIT